MVYLTSAPANTTGQLNALLQQRAQAQPQDRQAIDNYIWQTFGDTQAVMILDMGGFSKTTQECGIIESLMRIQQMNQLVRQAIRKTNGQVVKFEADNAFAIFSSMSAALEASLRIFKLAATAGIEVSIGLGYGDILLIENPIGHDDFFGDEVNLASKLGEDTATHGELMLTASAYHQLQSELFIDEQPKLRGLNGQWQCFELTISGLTLVAYQLLAMRPTPAPVAAPAPIQEDITVIQAALMPLPQLEEATMIQSAVIPMPNHDERTLILRSAHALCQAN